MKRTRNAVRNVIFGGLLKGYQILVPFIMRTLLIRYLGMEYLGLNSLFTSILQILNLAELGVGSALGYSMLPSRKEKRTRSVLCCHCIADITA